MISFNFHCLFKSSVSKYSHTEDARLHFMHFGRDTIQFMVFHFLTFTTGIWLHPGTATLPRPLKDQQKSSWTTPDSAHFPINSGSLHTTQTREQRREDRIKHRCSPGNPESCPQQGNNKLLRAGNSLDIRLPIATLGIFY